MSRSGSSNDIDMSGTDETCPECAVTSEEFVGCGSSDPETDDQETPVLRRPKNPLATKSVRFSDSDEAVKVSEPINQALEGKVSHPSVGKEVTDQESCEIPQKMQNEIANLLPTETVSEEHCVSQSENSSREEGINKSASVAAASVAQHHDKGYAKLAQQRGASPEGDSMKVKDVFEARMRAKMHSAVNKYQLGKKSWKSHDWIWLQKLKNMLDKKIKENDILRDSYLSCQKDLKVKEQKIKNLIANEAKMKQLYDECHKVERTANQKTCDYKAIIVQKNMEIHKLHQELARQRSQAFVRVQQKTNEIQTDHEVQSTREKKMCLKFKIKGLERELNTLAQKRNRLENEISGKSSMMESIKEQLIKLEKTKDEINKNISKLNNELKVKQNEKEAMNAEMVAMKECIDTSVHYKETSATLQGENEALKVEIATLKKQLSGLANRNIEFESSQRKCSSLSIFEPNLPAGNFGKPQQIKEAKNETPETQVSGAREFECGRTKSLEKQLTCFKNDLENFVSKQKGSIIRKQLSTENKIKVLEEEAQSLHEDINMTAVTAALKDQQSGPQTPKQLCAASVSEMETRLIHLLNDKDVIKANLESLKEEVRKQAAQVDNLMLNRRFLLNVILEYKKNLPIQAKYVKKVQRERDALKEKISGSCSGVNKKDKTIQGLRKEVQELKSTVVLCREVMNKTKGCWMEAIRSSEDSHAQVLNRITEVLGDYEAPV